MADMILVGSKLPQSIILKVNSKEITLKGTNTLIETQARNFIPRKNAVALTSVPSNFWEEWQKIHIDFPPLVNGIIFAGEKEEDVVSEAKEKKDVKSGFERKTTPKDGSITQV